MARPRRIEQVARQHRVDRKTAKRHTVARQDEAVALQVVPDFLDRRVLEHRFQPRERLLQRHLRTAVHARMPHGNVSCRVSRRRKRDPDNAGAHERGGVGQHSERESARSRQARERDRPVPIPW